eukprot:TRINITY_DN12391_c3_g1_i1.p1 TRINITY_DN12391_c3_g1~~TRINITY_DN12391_c3_g1_i1.p1  ORF type:complete len:107 (-),score=6.75 TRINITY_DN12391_c3_g1_i1:161-481(-)
MKGKHEYIYIYIDKITYMPITEIGRGLDPLGYLGYLLIGCLCFVLTCFEMSHLFLKNVSSRICSFTCYGFWAVGALGRFELSVSIKEAVFGFFVRGLFIFYFFYFF